MLGKSPTDQGRRDWPEDMTFGIKEMPDLDDEPVGADRYSLRLTLAEVIISLGVRLMRPAAADSMIVADFARAWHEYLVRRDEEDQQPKMSGSDDYYH
jgi:hypothetical protein